jgi:murein L,D-transpeptidase YcbB/YkuD
MRGRDVVWLRRQLDALDGRAQPTTASQVYDDELRRRVAAFQQVESLMPDGIAGEETLVRLAAAVPGANGPSLSSVQP